MPQYYRPTEVDLLLGDPAKAKEKLGWVPKTSLDVSFRQLTFESLTSHEQELVKEMVTSDMQLMKSNPTA